MPIDIHTCSSKFNLEAITSYRKACTRAQTYTQSLTTHLLHLSLTLSHTHTIFIQATVATKPFKYIYIGEIILARNRMISGIMYSPLSFLTIPPVCPGSFSFFQDLFFKHDRQTLHHPFLKPWLPHTCERTS